MKEFLKDNFTLRRPINTLNLGFSFNREISVFIVRVDRCVLSYCNQYRKSII